MLNGVTGHSARFDSGLIVLTTPTTLDLQLVMVQISLECVGLPFHSIPFQCSYIVLLKLDLLFLISPIGRVQTSPAFMCCMIFKLELLFLISAVGCFEEQGVVLNSAYSFPNIATCIRMLFLIGFSPKTKQERRE